MKFIILCMSLVLVSCESKNTFNSKPLSMNRSESVEGPSKLIFHPEVMSINKIKVCNQEIEAKSIVIQNREHQLLIEGKSLRLFKTIKIDFAEIYKIKDLDFNSCGSLSLEGSFAKIEKDNRGVILSQEGDDNQKYIVSKNYGVAGRDPLNSKMIFEINNPQLFLSRLIKNGELNLSNTEADVEVDSRKSFAITSDSYYEIKIENLNLTELEKFCLNGKCGNFLKFDTFVTNHTSQKEKIWIGIGNNLFWGSVEEIFSYISSEKTYTVSDFNKFEINKPISMNVYIKVDAETPIIKQKQSRISTEWVEQQCRYSNDRDRHNKSTECSDSSRSGFVNYITNEIEGFEKFKISNENFELFFPAINALQMKFNHCEKHIDGEVGISCFNRVSDELFAEKLDVLEENFSTSDRKVNIGMDRILSTDGAGRSGFRYNYALPQQETINWYRNVKTFIRIKMKILNPHITEEFYQN